MPELITGSLNACSKYFILSPIKSLWLEEIDGIQNHILFPETLILVPVLSIILGHIDPNDYTSSDEISTNSRRLYRSSGNAEQIYN